MLPGPDYIYKCPNCGNLLKRGSLMSGNTIGMQIFSDGKSEAPMLPDFPDLTKCTKCNTIFWLSKLKEIGTYEWGDKENPSWANADNVEFLNVEDYFRAIDEGLAENRQEELFIRQSIWWKYNDRIRIFFKMRKHETPYVNENDEIKWRENCSKLMNLLDPSDLDQKIMIAEIKRNLGNFEDCLDIIKQINDKNLNWLKTTLINECKKGNRWVVRLNQRD